MFNFYYLEPPTEIFLRGNDIRKTTLFNRIISSEIDPSLSESALGEGEDRTEIIREHERFVEIQWRKKYNNI